MRSPATCSPGPASSGHRPRRARTRCPDQRPKRNREFLGVTRSAAVRRLPDTPSRTGEPTGRSRGPSTGPTTSRRFRSSSRSGPRRSVPASS